MSYRDQWTDEHGADGLRAKFVVYKRSDRVTNGPCLADVFHAEERIGEDGEFIFVLRPESDHEAWVALGVYAHQVEGRAPQLAHDIRTHLERIYQNQELT